MLCTVILTLPVVIPALSIRHSRESGNPAIPAALANDLFSSGRARYDESRLVDNKRFAAKFPPRQDSCRASWFFLKRKAVDG